MRIKVVHHVMSLKLLHESKFFGFDTTNPQHWGENYVFKSYIKLLRLVRELFTQMFTCIQSNNFNVSFEIPEHEVDFMLDEASLTIIPKNPYWKSQANSEIDRLHKATLTLMPVSHHTSDYYCEHNHGSYCIDVSYMYVEIKQKRSQYAFGSTIQPDLLVNDSLTNYGQFMYDNFEWGRDRQWNTMDKHGIRSATNLIDNGDFENPNTIDPWECLGCKPNGFRNSYKGDWSVMVTNRDHSFSALTQRIQSTGGENYVFKSYIRLLKLVRGTMYTDVHVYVKYTDRYGIQSINVNLSIEIPEHEVDFLLDEASLTLLPKNTNWKSQADSEIDRLRKATLTLTPVSHHNSDYYCRENHGSYCIDISYMHVEIKQTQSQYAFGSTIQPDLLVNHSLTNYGQFMYDNFEWGKIDNGIQWINMESNQRQLDNEKLVQAMQRLRSHRLKRWGSGLFSALSKSNPDWISKLPLRDINLAIQDRINYMAALFNESFENLDVYSDVLQDEFLEIYTQSPNITQELFLKAKQRFPHARLFLDERNVLTSSLHTTAYTDMAKRLKSIHTPYYGLGIKAHFNSSQIDMDALKYRLDKLAEAKSPLWISSLVFHEDRVTLRAQMLDDVMTLLYSRPEVEGIILDDVWDKELISQNAALANGQNFQLNQAGYVYQNRWHTHETHHFTSTVSIRAYKGEYDIIVRRGQNGPIVGTKHVTLGNSGLSLTIHVTGQEIPQEEQQTKNIFLSVLISEYAIEYDKRNKWAVYVDETATERKMEDLQVNKVRHTKALKTYQKQVLPNLTNAN
ncbi:unnamed protein product [Mytilus coruscus]|uniref:GH10 domain-containing protein n=1 Tax=Mytilus coruscus TaxID=42192 RepID=A0A6J8BZ89_MYTCO|nr:unnamed protein product [Mytilus coruscus]